MSCVFDFNQTGPLTTDLPKIGILIFILAIDPMLFKLAGNKDMHDTPDEFEFRPDLTPNYNSCH